ncbi:GNAT family N-acetyltransferase [Nocardia sp. NPDC004168]|uniref:GNAT family N-acetyltransferase n=1 Tax=Nocardia TaxID=1817 RepID=UPI0033B48B60
MNPTRTPHVIARELTDIPDELRAVPAPPQPALPAPFDIRTADADGADAELLTEWMNRPHLIETWEQPWPVELRRQNLRAQLDGSYSRPYIVGYDFTGTDRPELGRRDIAYLELYRPAKDEIARIYHADPYDVAFHLATADPEVIGRGIMFAFVSGLLPGIFAAEPNCRRILIEPDHRNVAVRRMTERFGVPSLGDFDIRPDRRITLYYLPRTPADVPTVRR